MGLKAPEGEAQAPVSICSGRRLRLSPGPFPIPPLQETFSTSFTISLRFALKFPINMIFSELTITPKMT